MNDKMPSHLQIKALSDKLKKEDIRELYAEMLKNEALEQYTFPSKKSSDGFYHIYVADRTKKSGRRAIKAKDSSTVHLSRINMLRI